MTTLGHFVTSARHTRAGRLRIQLCVSSSPREEQESILGTRRDSSDPCQNATSGNSLLAILAKTREEQEFHLKVKKRPLLDAFVTFAHFTRRFTGASDSFLTFIPGYSWSRTLLSAVQSGHSGSKWSFLRSTLFLGRNLTSGNLGSEQGSTRHLGGQECQESDGILE